MMKKKCDFNDWIIDMLSGSNEEGYVILIMLTFEVSQVWRENGYAPLCLFSMFISPGLSDSFTHPPITGHLHWSVWLQEVIKTLSDVLQTTKYNLITGQYLGLKLKIFLVLIEF